MEYQHLRLAGLVGLLVLSWVPTPALAGLDAIPLYEPIDIGQMIRDAHPTTGTVSVAALNDDADTVGFAVIDGEYHAFVYTETHGVALLPGIPGYTYHKAVEATVAGRGDGVEFDDLARGGQRACGVGGNNGVNGVAGIAAPRKQVDLVVVGYRRR